MNDKLSLIEEIKGRGFLEKVTHQEVFTQLEKEKICFYVGFDPSADSFHLGQLAVFRLMSLLQKNGHKPILVIGGSTGSIGDPSGKNEERKLLSKEKIQENIEKLKHQFNIFFDFDGPNKAKILNNYDWTKDFSYLDFLRDVGKYFPVSNMIAKESVKKRINTTGITYTEFSYMLLQSYDFYHLSKTENCSLQIGGSDQWGNIVSGIDFIRKRLGKKAYGFILPLITKSDGSKFGKSEGSAVWLSEKKTSYFELYQYLVRSDDKDVIRFLKMLSDIPLEKIKELEKAHNQNPHLREAHHALAENVVLTIYGKQKLLQIKKANQLLYGERVDKLDDTLILEIFQDVPSYEISKNEITQGFSVVEALVYLKIAPSKAKARNLIESGGIYLNNQRIGDLTKKITLQDRLSENFILFRKGKKNYYLIKLQ